METVQFPDGAGRDESPVHAINQLLIPAPPERIWPWLIRASRWPEWYANARGVVIDGGGLDLSPGVQFHWTTLGVRVHTTVEEFVPGRRLAWSGRGLGATAYHGFVLTPVEGGTLVTTEETQRGLIASLARIHLRSALRKWHQRWLEGLALKASGPTPDAVDMLQRSHVEPRSGLTNRAGRRSKVGMIRIPFLFALLTLLGSASAQQPSSSGSPSGGQPPVPAWLEKEVEHLSTEQLGQEVAAIRKAYRDSVQVQGPAEPVAEVAEIAIPAGTRTIPARLYVPASSARPRPLVVYFHGGGFFSGDLDTHDVMVRRLANLSGASVLSVGYRLAPEHPFPAGLEDCYAAVAWAAEHASALGIDPDRLATAGDSAGANLSAAVVQLLRDRRGPRTRFQVLFYPVTAGLSATASREQYKDTALISAHYMALSVRAYVPRPADAASPLFATLRSDATGVPPTLVVSAGVDTLRDEGEDYAEMLKKAGVKAQWIRFGDAPHGFTQYFGQAGASPAGRLSLDTGAAALRAALAAR